MLFSPSERAERRFWEFFTTHIRNPNTRLAYPYLLRDLSIERANQVWASDISSIPMAKGFMYLVAIMD